jgi:diadenosine tetraphosphatase ApaH/serine/threonine PP2A family protein phosphatase
MTFNPEARTALEWTQKTLHKESISFLRNLPETIENNSVFLTHGSPRQPVWEYLMDVQTATINFDHFSTPYCFVGHTHLPVTFTREPGNASSRLKVPVPNRSISLTPRMIINPGSVGQPRDNDPRAAYAIYYPDEQTWEYRRIEYDIPSVQARMVNENLPARHILRLESGW